MKRAVSFSTLPLIREIHHRDDLSSQEKTQTWFTPQEQQQIRNHALTLTRAMSLGNLEELHGEECTRGLEVYTVEAHRIRRSKIVNAVGAVLKEQELQWTKGKKDAEGISKIYAESAVACSQAAHSRGIEDSQCFDDDDDKKDMNDSLQRLAL
jgi:hypothetical protein